MNEVARSAPASACSFCGRNEAAAGPLNAGSGGALICFSCIDRLWWEGHARQRGRTPEPLPELELGRLSAEGKRVLNLAVAEATTLQHDYIGTEHLLLAIMRENGLGALALHTLGLDIRKVRGAIEFIIGRGPHPVTGEVRLTPRAERALAFGLGEADRNGHTEIGSGYMLLGLIEEGEGIACGVLESLGVTLEKARAAVEALL